MYGLLFQLSFTNLKLYKTSAVKNISKAYHQPSADWQVNLAWARYPIENQYLVSGQLKKNMWLWWALSMSPWYGDVSATMPWAASSVGVGTI